MKIKNKNGLLISLLGIAFVFTTALLIGEHKSNAAASYITGVSPQTFYTQTDYGTDEFNGTIQISYTYNKQANESIDKAGITYDNLPIGITCDGANMSLDSPSTAHFNCYGTINKSTSFTVNPVQIKNNTSGQVVAQSNPVTVKLIKLPTTATGDDILTKCLNKTGNLSYTQAMALTTLTDINCENKDLTNAFLTYYPSATNINLKNNPIVNFQTDDMSFFFNHVQIGGYTWDINSIQKYFPVNTDISLAQLEFPVRSVRLNDYVFDKVWMAHNVGGINNTATKTDTINAVMGGSYKMNTTYKIPTQSYCDNTTCFDYENYIAGQLNDPNTKPISFSDNSEWWKSYNGQITPNYEKDTPLTLSDFKVTITDKWQIKDPHPQNEISFITPVQNIKVASSNGINGSVYIDSNCHKIGETCRIWFYGEPSIPNPTITLSFDNNYQKVYLPIKINYFYVPTIKLISSGENMNLCTYEKDADFNFVNKKCHYIWGLLNADDYKVEFSDLYGNKVTNIKEFFGTSDLYSFDKNTKYFDLHYDAKTYYDSHKTKCVAKNKSGKDCQLNFTYNLTGVRNYAGKQYTQNITEQQMFAWAYINPDQNLPDANPNIKIKNSKYKIALTCKYKSADKNANNKLCSNISFELKTKKKTYKLKFNKNGKYTVSKKMLKTLKKKNKIKVKKIKK
jgi:hypothetical protein